MKLKIGRFEIESDKQQFTIYEKRLTGENSKNPGEEVNSVVGYYSTLESCINSIPAHAVRRADAKDWHEIKMVIKEYRDLVHAALEGL